VIVLARAPVPGQVKTRLLSRLTPEEAAAVHRRLVRRTLRTVLDAGCGPVELWCAPDPGHPFFAELAASLPVCLHTQHGADLGERMHCALVPTPALLLGTDCADLVAADVQAAVRALECGHDAVLGPAADGGYVLIGLARPAPWLFADMLWGGPRVLGETRERLRARGWIWWELPLRHDVDRPQDLALLQGQEGTDEPQLGP
jgi:hypothetical protein